MDFLVDHYHTEDTNFSCESVRDGIYADTESDCRKFYVCEKTVKYHFSCPNGMRFFQRFETCSFVPAEEEANFNCNERVAHESRSIKSQSLQADEITEDTESHNMERRDDEENVDDAAGYQQAQHDQPDQTDAQEQSEQPSEQQSEPSYVNSHSLSEQVPQYHARSSGDLLSELSFLADDQGPAYFVVDQDEHSRTIQDRESVDEEVIEPSNPLVNNEHESPRSSHIPSGYTLCTIANVRSRRELRCLWGFSPPFLSLSLPLTRLTLSYKKYYYRLSRVSVSWKCFTMSSLMKPTCRKCAFLSSSLVLSHLI